MSEKELDRFLSGNDKVAVIKGDWGVGKTFFWENYVNNKKNREELYELAYSYTSLFGKCSLIDLKRAIFQNATPLADGNLIAEKMDEKLEGATGVARFLPWLRKFKSKLPWVKYITKHIEKVPLLSGYSGALEFIEYSVIDRYLICLDDIERKGSDLAIKDVMGLIDELATRKNCTVIVIFNEGLLEENDERNFRLYREKVIDFEFTYSPTIEENLQLLTNQNDRTYEPTYLACKALNLNNIRVIKKINDVIERFGEIIPWDDERIYKPFVVHLVVLCWGYYENSTKLNFELVCEHIKGDSWISLMMGDDDENEEERISEAEFSKIASPLQLMPFELDDFVIGYLETGILNDSDVCLKIEKLQEEARKETISSQINEVWELYAGSFENNESEFLGRLRGLVESEINYVSCSHFSSAVSVLEEFGQEVDDLIDRYVAIHQDWLKKTDLGFIGPCGHNPNNKLKEKARKIQEEAQVQDIDSLALRIAEERGWNENDITYLASLDKEDFKRWMKSSPAEIVTKIRGGLLVFSGISGGVHSSKYDIISYNVKEALSEIGRESKMNRMRVEKIYGVQVDDE